MWFKKWMRTFSVGRMLPACLLAFEMKWLLARQGLGVRGRRLAGQLHGRHPLCGLAMCMRVGPAQGTELSEQLARDDAGGGIPPELKNHYTAITRTASGAYGQVAYFTAFPQELGTIVVLLDDWIAGQMPCFLSCSLLPEPCPVHQAWLHAVHCHRLPACLHLPTAVLKRVAQRRSLLRQLCHSACSIYRRCRDEPGGFLMIPFK